ncbi:MAG TPA: T9SS type A sorting domain-containing protein [Chitinophagaceae bacterium]|nr:T9SS type A sorting domain-containing protein [Chitinophagaceae bacterium]
MNISTHLRQALPQLLMSAAVMLASLISSAQIVRPYGNPIYSDNLKGGHTIFGNTILAGSNMNSSQTPTSSNGYTTSSYGNDNNNMQWVDVDGTITAPPATIFNFGADWYYYRRASSGSNRFNYSTSGGPGSYTSTGYNQTSTGWGEDNAPIRFNTGSGGTTLSGSDGRATNRNTYYFRKTVNISGDVTLYTSVTLTVRYDDGVIVYINGTELSRHDMPAAGIDYNTKATSCHNNSGYRTATVNVPVALLQSGTNIIAAEVHQGSGCSSTDMYFDMSMSGTVPSVTNTFNSSSADLVLPIGTNTIKFARLYWGARILSSQVTSNDANLKTVKIRKGNGNYQTITGGQIDKITSSGVVNYQGYYDVTTFVKQNGAGTYSVADISSSTGSVNNGGNYGGWCMVVVYENNNRPYSSIRLYDGFINVQDGGTQTITLTGLNAPGTPVLASDAYMSAMAWEGDANLGATSGNPSGDYMEINGVKVSNALNPAQNFWNGSITKNGVHVASKFPNYINQMGLDIDEVEVGQGYNIDPNSTEVTVKFGTEADQYFPTVFAFTMASKPPLVELNKTGTITGPGAAQKLLFPNETITYTLSGKNSGGGDALSATIIDTIPFGLSYVPGTLVINSGGAVGPKTDAQGDDEAFLATANGRTYVKYYLGSGATPNSGGVLAPNQSYSVQFKCLTPASAHPALSVSNTARIVGTGVDGTAFVDDGTFLFGPGNTTLAVKLIDFKVKEENKMAILDWTTAGELKNERFEVERSTNGTHFSTVGTVSGNGTTNDRKDYRFTDPLPAGSSIFYYRLKDVDVDGKASYSKIVALRLEADRNMNSFVVYPNPFSTNLKLQVKADGESSLTVNIYNALGQREISRKLTLQSGTNVVVLQDLDNLKPGLHVLELVTEDGKMTQKIMKN